MKTLLSIYQHDIVHTDKLINPEKFSTREAARAVLLDSNNQVYLLNVGLYEYHKLPGGGIDPGETILETLKRELLEEVGCESEVICELGKIIEYRDFEKLTQTSYCFLARQIGSQKQSDLEESEIAEGMIEVKAKNVNGAIRILSKDKPTNIEGKFIQKRDLEFLQAAKKYIKEIL